jgi:Tfp pilus assembly protein PilP
VITDRVVKTPLEKAAPSSIFPLQKLSLDKFDLVGIAGDEKQRLAIMETKENKGRFYPIMLGTVIGLNKGKVVEIQNDRIIVEEVAQSKKGPKSNRITIKLHHINEEELP